MPQQTQDDLYAKTIQTIGVVAKLPVVRVERETFLRKEFAGSPHLEQILANGPQSVHSVEALQKKAKAVIRESTLKASGVAFASGIPANPALMLPAGAADLASYFAFALNLAQKIAFIFGEDEIFDGGSDQLTESAKVRIIGYLGVMMGASGAAALVGQVSKKAGADLGKKVASKALTKTAWYPILKKVGAAVGQEITKKTVQKTITKAVPVVGGLVSGGITFVTFRPMGYRLADTFAKGLRGEFEDLTDLELNPAFAAALGDADAASA